MKSSPLGRFSGCALIAITALSVPRASNAQGQAWKPASGPPPAELRWPGKHNATLDFKDASLTGKARWDLRGKLVSILWSHAPTLSGDIQEIATTYWPTTVVALQDGKTLLVAGKRPDGNTVIESWVFFAPVLVPKDTAHTEYSLEPAVIDRVETVFDAATEGKDLVAHLVCKLGSTSNVLVQFVDSRAVYDVDLAAKPPKLTLVAEPRAAASIPAVPQLVQRYTHVWSADHKSRGYVYAFVNDGRDAVSPLVLLDTDRNGTLDGSLVIPLPQWSADGWETASNYK
jgi:hypothetical protein